MTTRRKFMQMIGAAVAAVAGLPKLVEAAKEEQCAGEPTHFNVSLVGLDAYPEPANPIRCVWRTRAIKADGGFVHLSREGDHSDWDCAPDLYDPKMAGAFAPCIPHKITTVYEQVEDDALAIETTGGKFLFRGRDWDDFYLQKVIQLTRRPQSFNGYPIAYVERLPI